MTLNCNPQILRTLPTQILKLDCAVVLRRGCTEVKLEGEGIEEAIELIFDRAAGEGATREQLAELFHPEAKKAIEGLISELMRRGLLMSGDEPSLVENGESPSDVFYWQFGTTARRVHHLLRAISISILGVNSISHHLIAALQSSGFESIHLIDSPFDSHAYSLDSQISSETECVVATSEIGFYPILFEYNRLCLDQKRPFLPVVLQDMKGYIGPLVVPGNTPCLECLRLRRNSHFDEPEFRQRLEAESVAGEEIVGFHPTMSSVLGNIAAFELARFHSQVPRGSLVGSLTEIDLISGHMTTRKLLKIPRCPSCSSLRHKSSSTPQRYRITSTSRVTP